MKIFECADYDEMSQMATEPILSVLNETPQSWLVLATGNSPKGIYKKLVKAYHRNPNLFKSLGIVKLDEWWGLPPNDTHSCEYYLQEHIIRPLEIEHDRYIRFDTEALDPEAECRKIQNELTKIGQMELCILGVGVNGHLGFNEPSSALQAHCHVADLSRSSQEHSMVKDLNYSPSSGLTLGMADILQCKKIILLFTGKGKNASLESLLSGKINTQCPVSLLNLHPNVGCYIDKSSF